MKYAPSVIWILLLPACPVAGQVTADLTADDRQPGGPAPLRRAVLTIRNGLAQTIHAVSLHADDGGPRRLLPITAAPRGSARLGVSLPATSAAQNWTLRFFDRYDNGADPGPPARLIARTQASIRWPLDQVATDAIVNPRALDALDQVRPVWPTAFRQEVLIALAGMIVLAGFALFFPARWANLAAVMVVVAGASALLVWMLTRVAPPVVQARTGHVLLRGTDGRQHHLTVTRLTSLRTAEASAEGAGDWCLYRDRADMAADRTLLRPAEPAHSSGVPISSPTAPREMKMVVGVAGQRRAGEITARLDMPGGLCTLSPGPPRPAGVILVGDDVLPVPAAAPRTTQEVPLQGARPRRHLRARPEEFGFDTESLRLLTWWDHTYRRDDRIYLAWPDRSPEGPRLHVTTLKVH